MKHGTEQTKKPSVSPKALQYHYNTGLKSVNLFGQF